MIKVNQKHAKNLKAMRVSLGIKQWELAEALRYSQAAISQLENGTRRITESMAHLIITVVKRRWRLSYDGKLLGLKGGKEEM